MGVRKSISFTDQHDKWLKSQLASGQYGSESEVIRDLIRQAQKREENRARQAEFVREALRVGEESGVGTLTPEDVRQAVQARLRADGRL